MVVLTEVVVVVVVAAVLPKYSCCEYYCMCVCEGCIRDVANMLLLAVMAGAVYSHYILNDDIDKMMPAIVCFALLTLRLVTRMLLCACSASCQRKSATTEQHTKAE